MLVIVVFVPSGYADQVRQALAEHGAGSIGHYSACSFSSLGEGRFMPQEGSHPYIGSHGLLEVVDEVRIEAVCSQQCARDAIEAMLNAHPYEQPAWHCYQALTLDDLSSTTSSG